MDSRFITPLALTLALISLFANPQTSWAVPCRYNCTRTTGGTRPSSIIPVELAKLEQLIDKGQANANDYFRAGEIYTQLGDESMAQSRFNTARKLYTNQGNTQGVMNVNQKLRILQVVPSQIQIQQRQ
jgi:hypothetical protein